jgi:hypothetical protein
MCTETLPKPTKLRQRHRARQQGHQRVGTTTTNVGEMAADATDGCALMQANTGNQLWRIKHGPE